MTRDEILQFINENPIFALGTIDGDRPRVRYMMVSFADDRGIIFCTGKTKEVYLQLCNVPAVEMCFADADRQRQVRIEATAEETDDLEVKKAIVEKFDFLRPWVDEVGYEGLAAFRLADARACAWTMDTNHEAKEHIDL